MPGTITVRPIEANLTHNTDLLTKMNPYCTFVVGNTRVKGQVCKKGGKHPHWSDSITLPPTNESKILVELMDKDKITHDDNIGSFMLDLKEIESTGMVNRWYPLYHRNKPAGEILLEANFQQGSLGMNQQYGQQYSQQQYGQQSGQQYDQSYYKQQQYGQSGINQQFVQQEERQLAAGQPGLIQQGELLQSTTTAPILEQESTFQQQQNIRHPGKIFTEQRQVVEPHTFVKEVEVVETKPSLREIEVMEPVRVVKDVQCTEAVPVIKQIEVTEPQVVRKEIEVMEPKLVTKTIQVVENVPVKREVEVIEPMTFIKEVETLEPQTFNKQVEVTEYVPAKKQVEVTEPVTVRKAVEFVEPVITTQTVTKELQEAVVVDEKITKTVGPATVIGETAEYREGFAGERFAGERFAGSNLSEQERLSLSEEERLRFNQQQGFQHGNLYNQQPREKLSSKLERKELNAENKIKNKLSHNKNYDNYQNY